MYCPNCGTESDESAKFCRDCGQALSNAREEGKEDSKVTAILTAIRNLDGVDDKLLNHPAIGYLSTVLEDGELPDFVVMRSGHKLLAFKMTLTTLLVATNRGVIYIIESFFGSSFKFKSFSYSEVLSFEPNLVAPGILGGQMIIRKSDGKIEIVVTEKSSIRAFVDHVNAKIRPTEDIGQEQPGPESTEEKKTSDSQPERSDKSEESPATLADYMSARIQRMETRSEDAPSFPIPSNIEESEKHGADIRHRDRRSSFSRTETNSESRESSKSSGEVTTKQAAGCVIAIVAGIILWLGFSAILDITGWEPSKDCFGSTGEHIFEEKIRSRLSNPDSMQVHMIETEKVEDQPRYAAVAEVSAENAFGGRARIRAVGYLEETEDACVAVIVSMG